ncbi:MAG: HAMP domain-containing sensor histidine kinase [Deltaproteobacteria bacterium]|nr:HAMP domain-containing sensor histidine kinase [Deltaproteobacteria bacterium]
MATPAPPTTVDVTTAPVVSSADVPAPGAGLVRHDPARDSLPPQRAFLLLRYTLIIATAYLLLVEENLQLPPLPAILLVVLALASNVVVAQLPGRITGSPYFGPAIIVGDTLWITVALLLSGKFTAEFYFLYFFILLLAAIGETLWLIALAAVAVCGAYLYVMSVTGEGWSWWNSPSLIRIPFLFTAAAFYGYLVDRTRQERSRAQEADRIKSEFLGTISHELRTPLTVILGYVDLLLEEEFGAIPGEQRTVLGKVQAAGENLHRYLSRLLDVSRLVNRLQSGREAIVCSEFPLAGVFSELRYDFPDNPKAPVIWPATDDLPRLYTDREKLLTILRNLVENAVKYGGGQPVEVRVARASGDQLLLRVTDRGIGIAAADLPHIFDPFRRTAGAVATNAQGVGLGLYIVRQFVELLHGTIEVETAQGGGSTFTVRLPRQLQTPPAADAGRA